ncbi:MAG TPA: M42 family metallopeptidase [Gemmatimonadaceae bacterium]|jgi:endoglucanase|nr:M42 family metallopeptidase [Gemmatimonadaceae bacterium]
MLSTSSLAFLKRLLDTPAPSGFEGPAARVWREEASSFADKVTSDVSGNSMAEVNPDGSPTILLDGHIDEIGVIVQYIDDDGYVYFSPIGGWDPQVLVGQRIRFLGRGGDVLGVVGRKPIHLIKVADREHAAKLGDLWIDIGASSRAEAEGRLSVGDPGVIDSKAVDFPNNRIVSRSIDDRIGAFVVLEALRRYAQRPGTARVVAAATTQEEIAYHGGGALVCTNCINPQLAIVVDVTFATDHPSMEKKEIGDHRIGGGPVISRGSIISPVVFDLLRTTAERNQIKYTVHAAGRETSTNADAIHIAREGVATALVSVPNRYMHSPNELVSLEDVDKTASLLAETCREVSAKMDFAAR